MKRVSFARSMELINAEILHILPRVSASAPRSGKLRGSSPQPLCFAHCAVIRSHSQFHTDMLLTYL